MTQYVVKWVIDVEADSAAEAAQQARIIQLDPDNIATCFEIYAENSPFPLYIDLLDDLDTE